MALPQDHADSNVNTIRLDGTQDSSDSSYILERDMNGDILSGIAVTTLTVAQIKALIGTPLTIVAAKGSGKTILVDNAVLSITTTTCPFTAGGVLSLTLGTSLGAVITGTMTSAAVVATASTTTVTDVISAAATLTGYDNTPLVLSNATAAFAFGVGCTGKLTTKYRVVAI